MELYSPDPARRLPGDGSKYLRSKYLYSKVAFKQITPMQLAGGRKDGSILIPSCYNVGLMSPCTEEDMEGLFYN